MMRSRLLVPVLLVAGLAACADRATSPLAPAAAATDYVPGDVPPPPFDALSEYAGTTFQTQYFLNKPGNNGFITFRNNAGSTQFTATPNARISYHNGVVSGQGVLTFTQGASVFDLANVTAATFKSNCLGGCGSFIVKGTSFGETTFGHFLVGITRGGDFGVAGF